MGSIRLGIDTGGTFTDLISFDVDTGELKALKVASTPHEPLKAFIGSIPYRIPVPFPFPHF